MAGSTTLNVSLLARLSLAFLFIGAVTLTIAFTGAIFAGITVLLGLAVLAFLATFLLGPLIDGTAIAQFWELSVSDALTIVFVFGILLLPILYVIPARRELRSFREQVKNTGTLAEKRHPEIATMGKRLAQQASIPEPEIRIVNRSRPESYALDGDSNGTIVITRGVIRQLETDEIEAVLAHEVSHLANRDSRFMTLMLLPMLVAEDVTTTERPRMRGVHLMTGVSYIPHLLLWALLVSVSTVQLLLCQLGVAVFSRGRELAADRAGAKLTGSPATLASALGKLDDARSRPSTDKRDFRRSAGVLDILPTEHRHLVEGPFKTHPDTETRIKQLESLVVEMENQE